MTHKVFSSTLIVFIVIRWTRSANILTIFCTPSQSHVILGAKLTEGLLKRGHHVTFLSPYTVEPMQNLTHYNLNSIHEYKAKMSSMKSKTVTNNVVSMFQSILRSVSIMNELFWEDPIVKRLIEEKSKYDLVIVLSFFHDAVLGFGPHVGAPTIVFSCVGSNSIYNSYVANPTMVYSKNLMLGVSTDSFWGRLVTVTANMLMNAAITYQVDGFNQDLLDKYLPNSPPLRDLQRNVSLVFANSHVSIEPARPYVPNMIQIGGFHVQDSKPLPEEFKKFLDEAKQGAILFSLGSNLQVSMIDKDKQDAIFKVLGEMNPIRVIVKSELNHENLPKNIMLKTWMPQADILERSYFLHSTNPTEFKRLWAQSTSGVFSVDGHPSMKLFISHGGLGGITESVHHGVPILAIPFYDDQVMNANDIQMAGYAEVIHIDDVTEELFRFKLQKMLSTPKYKTTVLRKSAFLKEQPVKPMDNAVFWIEHVIKFGGGSHLQNAGVHLEWYQLYMVDIYIFFTAAIILLSVFCIYIIKVLMKVMKKLFRTNHCLENCEQKAKQH